MDDRRWERAVKKKGVLGMTGRRVVDGLVVSVLAEV